MNAQVSSSSSSKKYYQYASFRINDTNNLNYNEKYSVVSIPGRMEGNLERIKQRKNSARGRKCSCYRSRLLLCKYMN